MNASWETASAANVQRATVEAPRSPTPRKPQRGRKRKPERHSGATRIRPWAAMESVALPARSQIIGAV